MQNEGALAIGVDFGSDSARAILVRTDDGTVLASCAHPYARWGQGLYSDAALMRFRQHPHDYAEALRVVLHGVLDGRQDRSRVACIGVDATASTPCLADAEGLPLALRPEFADEPDAMFALWKDHTAENEARLITDAAQAHGYCMNNGGVYSPENGWAKVWHIVSTNPAVADVAASVVEECDYIVSLLTGRAVTPSYCAAAYKWMWRESWGGYPPEVFFRGLGGGKLAAIRASLRKEPVASSASAGTLSRAWTEELGLPDGVTVGGGNIDAHSGAVGAGCNKGTAAFILGTSGCIMYAVPREDFGGRAVDGVFGQAPGSIIAGLEGFEAGLAAFGDSYAWVGRLVSEPLASLDRKAAALVLDDSVPVATDWLNGRRSPYQDPSVRATVTGIGLGTDAARLYFAMVEATAFGVRAAVEHLEANGVRADRNVAIGGIAGKSPFVMQMLADVLGRTIEVSSSGDACALGSAINASVAAGLYGNVAEAQARMCAPSCATYRPRPGHDHEMRYAMYRRISGI